MRANTKYVLIQNHDHLLFIRMLFVLQIIYLRNNLFIIYPYRVSNDTDNINNIALFCVLELNTKSSSFPMAYSIETIINDFVKSVLN